MLATVGAASGFGLAGFGGVLAVLGLLGGLWLEPQLAAALVLKQALAVAAGQPAENLRLNRVDEIGLILRAVNQAGQNLRSLVDDVCQPVAGLQTASGEIAQGNNDLSSRTEQAASSLQQTAASMEQMTPTVTQNADGARQVAQLAGEASAAAVLGGTVAGEVRTLA